MGGEPGDHVRGSVANEAAELERWQAGESARAVGARAAQDLWRHVQELGELLRHLPGGRAVDVEQRAGELLHHGDAAVARDRLVEGAAQGRGGRVGRAAGQGRGAGVTGEVREAGVGGEFERALEISQAEYERLAAAGLEELAPYALSLGYRIRYVLDMNAREAMHLIELRSGREGHPSYRAVAHEMHRQIAEVHPMVAAAMTHVDHETEPRLERILSEMRTQAKLEALERAPHTYPR